MSIQISGPSIPPDGSVTAAKINSGAATVGFVLTANGAAGATFAELPAAGGGILASGATVGATAQAQIFTTGVGVGASPPTAMLGVRGADSLNTSFASNISGATGTGLVVTNAGNVGIGTTGPGAKLHVVNNAIAGPSWSSNVYSIVEGDNPIMILHGTSGGQGAAYGFSFGTSENIGSIAYEDTGPDYMKLYVNSSPVMTLKEGGNVGIGTTSPTAALHLPASSTARASLCIPAGAAPTIPVEGDVWTASGKMYIYIGAVTKEIAFV